MSDEPIKLPIQSAYPEHMEKSAGRIVRALLRASRLRGVGSVRL